jgi:hypothetical protein
MADQLQSTLKKMSLPVQLDLSEYDCKPCMHGKNVTCLLPVLQPCNNTFCQIPLLRDADCQVWPVSSKAFLWLQSFSAGITQEFNSSSDEITGLAEYGAMQVSLRVIWFCIERHLARCRHVILEGKVKQVRCLY